MVIDPKTSGYPNTTVCKRCKAIFGNGLTVYYGYYRDNDTSDNAFVPQTAAIKLAKGECPICRHVN